MKKLLGVAFFAVLSGVVAADGLKWKLNDDAHNLKFTAEVPNGREVSLFLDVEATGETVYRIVFSQDAKVRDAVARDDNTNRDRFAIDDGWCSRAAVKVENGNGSWLLEATLPFGAIPDVGMSAKKWGVRVSLDELVSKPKSYERRPFPKFDRDAYSLVIADVESRVRKVGGVPCVCVSLPIFNSGKAPSDLKVSGRMDVSGRSASASVALKTVKRRVVNAELAVPCGGNPPGTRSRLNLDLLTADGILLREIVSEVECGYSPVMIRMISPCYRDCVFDTMDLKNVSGEVVLEEGMGRPLSVTLSGPGTKEVFRIASAAATNRFSFAFSGKAKGEYLIRAGNVEKRIRNLPYRKGEVWIDSNKVIHRDGKKIFPYGWFSETFGRMYPGVNVAQSYYTWMRSLDDLDALTDEAEANSCGLIIPPMQRCTKIPYEKLFGVKAARQGFDADGLGDERRAAVTAFAKRAAVKNGFFAYYLQDEPEGRNLSPAFFREMKRILEEVDPYHPTMMVNYTVDGIRRFADTADILCPDTYPVYIVGGRIIGKLSNTYKWAAAAAQYGTSAMFAPQAFDWDYKTSSGKITRGPTYSELRAQSLLAIAGDARGLLLYSRFSMNTPSEHLRMGGEFLAREIIESQELFLAPSQPVDVAIQSGKGEVAAVVKRSGMDMLLIAVNMSGRKARASFSAKGLPGRLYVGGEAGGIKVSGGAFSADFGPLEAKVFHAKPKKFSPEEASREIEAAEVARRKPGNIALAPKFLTWVELKRLAKGDQDAGFPRFTATTSKEGSPRMDLPYAYFLQDGFADVEPYLPYHGWTPDNKDPAPSVKIEFGGKKRFSRIVATCCRDKSGKYAVSSATVAVDGRTVAEMKRGDDGRMTADFAPIESDAVTVYVKGRHINGKIRTWTKRTPWLSEIEVY